MSRNIDKSEWQARILFIATYTRLSCFSPNLWLPGTYGHDSIWKWGLCKCKEVKTRSHWNMVGSELLTGILIERGNLGRETQGECHVNTVKGVIHLQTKKCRLLVFFSVARRETSFTVLEARKSKVKQGRLVPFEKWPSTFAMIFHFPSLPVFLSGECTCSMANKKQT